MFGPPLIRRVLDAFVPDEFCPDPIPGVVLEALTSEVMIWGSFRILSLLFPLGNYCMKF